MAHVLRVPKFDLAALLAQQNPHIDLRIEAYETSTRNFLKAVSQYTQVAQAEITRRKNEHLRTRKQIAEEIQKKEKDINQCKFKELELIAELDKEREEKKEAELVVANLERKLAAVKDQVALLDGEIEQTRAVVTNLRRERDRERSILENHASQTSPEAGELEQVLKLVIEGVDKDKTLIRFTHIDETDVSREFSIVLDVSSRQYRVPTSSPTLPTLPILLEELNESRELFTFIKNVRHAFEQLVTQGK